MSPGPLVIGWHDDIGDLSPVITGPSTGLREKQTLTWVTNKLHHHQGSFTLTRRHRVTSERSEICPWADIGQVWQLASAGHTISVITMECAACLITLLTDLAPEPRISGVYWLCVSPNVYSMLIAFVFKLQLENCIQTQFASNLHQIIDITWWFLATLEFQIRFWGIISIHINRNSIYKLDCVVKLVSIVRRPVQPRQVTLLTPSPGATLQSGPGQGVTSKL